MKKYLIYLYVLLFVIFGIISWLFFFQDKIQNENQDNIKRERSGPSFKMEGELYFLENPSKDTLITIIIEVADTYEEIGRGMMYRNRLENNQGMLFIFEVEEEQSFWMKNTRIPLDIIFINGKFQIVHIAKHTIPYSKDPIPSMHPAKYVLEVNAGFCDNNSIAGDDYVRFIIDNSLSL